MVRQKVVDSFTGERRGRKEYLTFTSKWYGHDYFGSEIVMENKRIEGQYKKQVRKLANKLDMTTGRMNSRYEMDIPVVAYTSIFSGKCRQIPIKSTSI
jgi:hypothetical protein